ncbi:uncharacterized protein LOC133391020 isoform X1 [Anopheles gambiae]|uniref:uncharacterized protein LOC133391020 isoform X1 n=1 Tax=Anopheles gambiae TaxID=7165 RepID=UPI002AC90383|nr:uncharacterized protein LOC133391020 isoform X1 [Anopheles gambiae]XP_061496654.1 uncharacterized protein LOC133391020 isoform X1 [Anopheles gambiae]XP_061496655.1 uncharacterized protein LOC133391020 isoform X1 [Anopheles gambiae]XP_061496656.1 uncharacterized protein LOC133391020 isoform X1 [Anopheles gambiae]XP_061496657.1 uncharacterized protein LOC133391020 isoform X1 [Anopheles gambiae]
MNPNYVKKCADFLQNIPTHKLAATNIAATGVAAVASTEPSCPAAGAPQQPQSKPESIGNRAFGARKTPQRPDGGGAVGMTKRPVWRHPAAGPVAPFPRPQQPAHASEQQKFVRSCCPSRRPDTSARPGRARVDCRWDAQGGKHTPTPQPTLPPTGEMSAGPKREGRGDADNVNHRDGIGQTSVECQDRQPPSWSGMLSQAHPLPAVSGQRKDRQPAGECDEFTDCSSVDNNHALHAEDEASNRKADSKLFQFHPLRTVQFLCLELTNKLRALGPEHRSLYKIGKELSIVVRFLSHQQQTDPPEATVKAHPQDGTDRTQDKPECPNCQLLQRNWQDDRDRHAQESAQLTEQINYLQTQLRTVPRPQDVGELVREQYRRMENDITKLKLAVDEKNVELVLINDLKRNLKEALARAKRTEQERAELEKRLLEAQMENKRLELFLDTQAINFRKVKSELSHIHQLSSRQIQYLDEPIDSLVQLAVSPRRHHRGRQPSLRNYASTQSSECDTTSSRTLQSPRPEEEMEEEHNQAAKSSPNRPEMDVAQRKAHSNCRTTTTTTSTSGLTPDESMPSLAASQSDRDNATGSTQSSTPSWIDRPRRPGDDNGKDNERHRQVPGINRGADHDDNRIRHRASDSDYSAGKLTGRPLDDGDAQWQQFVVELAENITLPSSPRPFRHNLSIAQLSDLDDSLMSDAAAALSKCRAGDATPSSQGSNLCNSSSSSKFTKQLQTK